MLEVGDLYWATSARQSEVLGTVLERPPLTVPLLPKEKRVSNGKDFETVTT